MKTLLSINIISKNRKNYISVSQKSSYYSDQTKNEDNLIFKIIFNSDRQKI